MNVYKGRTQIVPRMLQPISDASSSMFHAGLFDGERANNMDELMQELFFLFWEEARYSLFKGWIEMLPHIDPQTCCNITSSKL